MIFRTQKTHFDLYKYLSIFYYWSANF